MSCDSTYISVAFDSVDHLTWRLLKEKVIILFKYIYTISTEHINNLSKCANWNHLICLSQLPLISWNQHEELRFCVNQTNFRYFIDQPSGSGRQMSVQDPANIDFTPQMLLESPQRDLLTSRNCWPHFTTWSWQYLCTFTDVGFECSCCWNVI